MDVSLDWKTIGMVLGAFSVGGGGIGYVVFHAAKVWKTLEGKVVKQANKQEEEDHKLRDTLLTRYKEAYELTKQQADREIANLNKRIDELQKDMDSTRSRQRELADENDRLRELNIRYQDDKRRDALRISDLEQTILTLKGQVHEMSSKLGIDHQ